MAVERYFLQELTPDLRDEFEEHFFDCQECATDVRETAEFIAAAKREFEANPVPKPGAVSKRQSRLAPFWPAVAWSALAASLLVIAYQNVFVYPRFKSEIAELKAPEILPSLSLVNGNSRGGSTPEVQVGATHAFLLLLDIPTQDRFSSYTCLLYSSSGSLSWRAEVSAESAKDTVSIRVPSASVPPGEYRLTVQGNMDRGGTPVDLGSYHFVVNGRD